MTKVKNVLRIVWEVLCVLVEIINENRKEGK